MVCVSARGNSWHEEAVCTFTRDSPPYHGLSATPSARRNRRSTCSDTGALQSHKYLSVLWNCLPVLLAPYTPQKMVATLHCAHILKRTVAEFPSDPRLEKSTIFVWDILRQYGSLTPELVGFLSMTQQMESLCRSTLTSSLMHSNYAL